MVVFLLPLFHRVFNMGTIIGAAAGGGLIAIGIYWNRLNFTEQKYIAFVILICLMTYLLISYLIIDNSRGAAKADTLIVLGCQIKGDVPSLSLEKRINCAFYYLIDNPNAVAILSGGQGKGENLSEAQCMYNHLVDKGIDKSRLFIEDKSVNTNENIKLSLNIIEAQGIKKEVAIATSEYHQYRAKLICDKYDLISYPVASKTMPILLPTFVTREIIAIIKQKLLPNVNIK